MRNKTAVWTVLHKRRNENFRDHRTGRLTFRVKPRRECIKLVQVDEAGLIGVDDLQRDKKERSEVNGLRSYMVDSLVSITYVETKLQDILLRKARICRNYDDELAERD